ncbi:hypothetical protein, partial [Enterovibrio norvegicus]
MGALFCLRHLSKTLRCFHFTCSPSVTLMKRYWLEWADEDGKYGVGLLSFGGGSYIILYRIIFADQAKGKLSSQAVG